MTTGLQRFKDAQNQRGSGFESALAEIQSGGKRGHWIWYVFPQLAGLGYSSMSQAYAIENIGEAEAYLRDSVLRRRYLTIAIGVLEQVRKGRSLDRVMASSIDVQKLVSSLTLFGNVARRLHATEKNDEYVSLVRVADELLAAADAEGYPRCEFTLGRLTS